MPGESSIESLSTDSVESVPKSTIDTVEPFRQFSFHRKAWSDIGLGRTFQFKPAQYAPQQVIEPFNYKVYVPYQLELGKLNLFPEFYYLFKKAFAKASNENQAYSYFSLDKFSSFWVGTQEEVSVAVGLVENDFEQRFKKCLHPDLLDEYSTLQFNRKGVETTFRDAIIADIDELSTAERMNELITEARKGTVGPFIEFLMAYDHDEDYIWFMVSFVYSKNAQTTKQKKIFSDLKDKFRKATNLSLMRRVRDFVANLKSEDIIVEKQPAKSVDKAPAKVKVNNTTQSQASGGENDGYSSSSQKKRKPQYTQAEKAAYKDRKKKARTQKKSGGEFGGDVSKKTSAPLQSLNTDPSSIQIFPVILELSSSGMAVQVYMLLRIDLCCRTSARMLLVIFSSQEAKCMRGAGDIKKVRFKDGSVGVLYDVFWMRH
ncbi:hypothetical protein JCM33374_g4823 [Metschnikowia sp. JCM 33374]|nr:hypothetical protein JCM33374_g4823 [Metschnikowia sp. JCM 33374]